MSAVPTAAHAAYGVIEDEGLAACINRSLGGGRDDAQAITPTDLGALRVQFSCGEGPAIRSFAGFESATRTLSITLQGDMHELNTPGSMTALGSLPKLSRLVLSKVNVTDEGLSGISTAPNLQTVEITGAPALASVTAFAGKPSLTSISLTHLPALTDLTGLADLVRLKTLDLGYNEALQDLGPLRGLTALERLTIQYTAVADLGPLSNLESLQHLAATGAKINSLTPLSKLLSLQRLWVVKNELSSLDGLENLEALTHVWASHNNLTGKIGALANKPNLIWLDIRGTGTTSLEVLAASTSLGHLDAVDNNISSLVGLAPTDAGTSLSVTNQTLSAPTQFVPRNAESFRVDAGGQLSLRDGVTFPPLHDSSTPATGPVPDPELPFLSFTKLKNAKVLDYQFLDGTGFNTFSGRVEMPIVWSDITSDDQFSATVGTPFSHQLTVTEGFPALTFSLASDAPAWLKIDAQTGLISATPTTAGEVTVTVLVADSLGNTITQTLVISVEEAARQDSVVSVGPDQKADAGADLSFTITRANAVEDPWTGEAAVDVETQDGSAIAGTHYVRIRERLVWAADDDAAKTVKVSTLAPKTRSTVTETTLRLELSNPGAHTALGSRTVATGTIVAEDGGEIIPPKPGPDPKPQPGTDPKPDPGKGGGLAESGQAGSLAPWLAGGGVLLVAGAAVLIARRFGRGSKM